MDTTQKKKLKLKNHGGLVLVFVKGETHYFIHTIYLEIIKLGFTH